MADTKSTPTGTADARNEPRRLTGLNGAMVRVKTTDGKNDASVLVQHGEPFPAEIADGELERLERLGGFAEMPQSHRVGLTNIERAARIAAEQGTPEPFTTPVLSRPARELPGHPETADEVLDAISRRQQETGSAGKAGR